MGGRKTLNYQDWIRVIPNMNPILLGDYKSLLGSSQQKVHWNQIKLISYITEMVHWAHPWHILLLDWDTVQFQHWLVKCQIPTGHIKLFAAKINYTT